MKKQFFFLLIAFFLLLFSFPVLGAWWDLDYSNRVPVNIFGSHSAIDTNYTFSVSLDTNDASFALSDLNDLRVIAIDNNGDFVQLHRDIYEPKTANTTVYWKSYKAIAANTDLNASDTNGYWIYYNNSSPDLPPREWIKIYWYGDDFNRSDLASGYYTDYNTHNVGAGETAGIVNGRLDLNGEVAVTYNQALLTNNSWYYESSVSFDIVTGSGEVVQRVQQGFQSCTNVRIITCPTYTSIIFGNNNSDWYINNSSGDGSLKNLSITANTMYDLNWLSTTTDYNAWFEGSTSSDPSTKLPLELTDASFPGFMSGFTGQTFSIDWVKVSEVLEVSPTVSIGAEQDFNSAIASFTSTKKQGLILGEQNGAYDFNSTSIALGDTIRDLNWFVDGVRVKSSLAGVNTDLHYQDFNVSKDYNVTLIITTTTHSFFSQAETTIDFNLPVLTYDYNFNTGFEHLTADFNSYINCVDNNPTDINFLITLNDVNYLNSKGVSNENKYYFSIPAIDGLNTWTFGCIDGSKNYTYDLNTIRIFRKFFYFVYAKNGENLIGQEDYNASDVNSVIAYSFQVNPDEDMYSVGDVNLYYNGISDDKIRFEITYNETNFPTTTLDFDLSVLDTNTVPVCFSKLRPFYEQRLTSTNERQVILKSALTNCYLAAAKTDYSYNDLYKLSVYTVPLAYNLFLRNNSTNTLLALIDGAQALEHNLDLLLINSQDKPEVVVQQDVLAANEYCQINPDCNNLSVRYISVENNNSVTIKILKGTTVLTSYSATSPDANNVSFVWNFTNADTNAEFFTLKAIIIRADGTTDTMQTFFTLKGTSGLLDPTIAVIIAFFVFLFGITLVASRFALGFFGIFISFIALLILAFAPGVWYITFMQGMMIVVIAFIFLTYKQETAKVA